MENFYDKTEYAFEDVISLINNEVEESINLDFKEADALDKSDGKRKDISKDVASFANSDGGIIVYGIREENHKAKNITFINGNEFTKEWLEQIINSSIQRRISGILIYPIRKDGKIEETIYIVKIPKSLDAPHLSKDKRFYRRFNFESVPMEEYEIRQSYGQKIKSKLVIDRWLVKLINYNNLDDKDHQFQCEVTLLNIGDILEASYKVNVYLLNFNRNIKFSWAKNQTHYDYTWLEDKKVKVSAHGLTPIYPDESINAIRFDLYIPKEKFEETISEIKIEIALFYLNGEDKMDVNAIDFLDIIKNKEIMINKRNQ